MTQTEKIDAGIISTVIYFDLEFCLLKNTPFHSLQSSTEVVDNPKNFIDIMKYSNQSSLERKPMSA